jgi:hypothetical protein
MRTVKAYYNLAARAQGSSKSIKNEFFMGTFDEKTQKERMIVKSH